MRIHSVLGKYSAPFLPRRLANFAGIPAALVTSMLLLGTPAMGATPSVVADVTLTPAGDFKGHIDEAAAVIGEAVQAGDHVEASRIVVKLEALKTGLSLRDKHAKEKYLEVEKFPEAVLRQAVGDVGKGHALLAMHGIEKEVRGTYAVNGGALTADFPILLSDYGISGIKYLGIGVDDHVLIHVTVPVTQKAPTSK